MKRLLLVAFVLAVLPAVAGEPKQKNAKAPKAAEGPKIVASCDIPEVGSCYDFTAKAKEQSDDLCESLGGKAVPKPCTGDVLGSCEFSSGYFRRFHTSGPGAWSLKMAQDDCKEKEGTWR